MMMFMIMMNDDDDADDDDDDDDDDDGYDESKHMNYFRGCREPTALPAPWPQGPGGGGALL